MVHQEQITVETSGHRHMHEGAAAEIHLTDSDGGEISHEAHEETLGVYEAHHTFSAAGEAHVEMHFQGDDGAEHVVEFTVPVDHGH